MSSEDIEQLGKYRILGELGRGAMGVVYRGFDPLIEREVAIKTLRADLLDGAEKGTLLARFKKEAQAAGRLNHPGIVQVYEYGEDGDRVFIAMELIVGKELRDYMNETARFDIQTIVRMMRELMDALAFAHANGVVHRDIKPSNIVLLNDGRIKITDFGIARLESSTLTQAGNVLGTPSYMSPEQFMGQRVDGRSDLFSCGVMLYELLTGEKPFVGNSFATIMHKVLKESPIPPSNLNITLPAKFDEIIAKALAKRPDERFQDAQAFSAALQDALDNKSPAVSTPHRAATPAASDATIMVGGNDGMDATVAISGPDAMEATRVTAPASQAPASQAPAPAARAGADTVVLPAQTTAAPASSRMPLILGVAAAALLALGGGAFMLLGGDPPAAPATAEAPASALGVVAIESDPPGAVVLIDGGQFGGVTPARIEVPVGTHQISIRKDGHNQIDSSIEVTAGAEIPFQAVLMPIE